MTSVWLPIFLFVGVTGLLATGLMVLGRLVGPQQKSKVKEMPYESGMNPIHDARRRFDVRFHLVAIAFLIFDVELLFLFPWAVASRNGQGIDRAVSQGLISGRGIVFGGVLVFIALLALGLIYDWRKGVFRWR